MVAKPMILDIPISSKVIFGCGLKDHFTLGRILYEEITKNTIRGTNEKV